MTQVACLGVEEKFFPLRRQGRGVWRSRDERWEFILHFDGEWLAFFDGNDYACSVGQGCTRLGDVVDWAVRQVKYDSDYA